MGTPVPRVADLYKAVKSTFELSALQVVRLKLCVLAVGGAPQPSHAAIQTALSEVRPALDMSAALGSGAAGFGAGAWLVGRVDPLMPMQPFPPASHEVVPPRSPSPSQKSASAIVGPTFEDEARTALTAVLPEVCPWLTRHSRVLCRQLELLSKQRCRQADVLCHAEGDTLVPCVNHPAHGFRVITF